MCDWLEIQKDKQEERRRDHERWQLEAFIEENEKKYCKGICSCLYCEHLRRQRGGDGEYYSIPDKSPGRCDVTDDFLKPDDLSACLNWVAIEHAMEEIIGKKNW